MPKQTRNFNPWHDVSPGEKCPTEINAIIEVPMGSSTKYEIDKETGMIKLDRVLYSPVHYPADYGFIPRTYWEDDDPLDIIVISNFPVNPLTLVKARPVGVLRMIDKERDDTKIIAVHSTDPRFDGIKNLKDISEHTIKELRHFFEIYKELQGVKVTVV
ncbi:MAG TPA: inorganic pyrophosphatase, partial [Nitrospiraceae bacterium]|nr:inorganic pyrophosphatase [Nitrospiraceae bacterium]